MANRGMVLACAVVALSFVVTSTTAAQGKKPKPPESYPGTAIFRCNGLTTPDCTGDSIVGDGSGYSGLGVPEGGEGAHIKASIGEMWIGLKGDMGLFIDFGQQDPGAPCLGGGYCQFDTAFPDANILIEGGYTEIQTEVFDPLNSSDLSKSLIDIPIGATWDARLYIGFNDPYTGKLWNFNFSSARNPAFAGDASIKRLATCSWEITDGGRKAELSTLVRVSGKQFRSYEGFYLAPFLITFSTTTCGATP